jgi:hypothetical protein
MLPGKHSVILRFATPLMAVLLLSTAAQAAPLRDGVTGLSVTPPPGYVAEALVPGGGHTARFAVRRPGETDVGCQVGFSPAPRNAVLSQTQINTMIDSDAWQDVAKAALAPVYDVTGAATADHAGIRNLILLADFKPRRELPPTAREMRTYFAIMETPRGRTSIVCVGRKGEFSARRVEFDAVTLGTSTP